VRRIAIVDRVYFEIEKCLPKRSDVLEFKGWCDIVSGRKEYIVK